MARQHLILDRYRIEGQAGAGGYGTVLRAYDTRLKRRVAIKTIELTEADVARAHLLAMEERIKSDSLDWDAEDAVDSSAPSLGNVGRGRAHDPRFVPLPWEDDFALPEEADFPDDPDFIAADFAADSAVDPDIDPADGPNVNSADDSGASVGPTDINLAAGSDVDVDDPEADPADDLFDHIPGLEEARTAAHLNDVNIVTVYDCEVRDATAYVIMEYVEGKTLAAIMREMGDDMSLDVVATVFASVAHALEVAHDNDVLHLDIKPENVIVNKKGVVKVMDFGLATLMDASGRGTAGGGTIGYMPLEQMRQQALDARTDEWALASLTYEMLSGSNPFTAQSLERAEELIENAELVLPSLCWDTLNPAADDIVFTALDPEPDDRYASVAEFADALSPLLGNVRAGKRALAAAVSEEEPAQKTPEQPREPLPPLIDRLGPKGATWLARVVSAAGAAMVGAVSLVNIRLSEQAAFGLASEFPLVFWPVLAALVALAVWRPALAAVPAFALFAGMLLMNFGFLPAVVLIAAFAAWWWACGRHGIGAAASAFLQPLAGSVGFAALSPVVAGAVLLPRDAAMTAAAGAVLALSFAALGSGDIAHWNIVANAVTPANASIAGGHIFDSFVATLAQPLTWCIALSWVGAASLFSLFCERGTRKFDIMGACVAAAILVGGLVLGSGLNGLLDAFLSGAAFDAASWVPQALSLASTLAAGGVGIALAVMNVPDRVRLAEGEW